MFTVFLIKILAEGMLACKQNCLLYREAEYVVINNNFVYLHYTDEIKVRFENLCSVGLLIRSSLFIRSWPEKCEFRNDVFSLIIF